MSHSRRRMEDIDTGAIAARGGVPGSGGGRGQWIVNVESQKGEGAGWEELNLKAVRPKFASDVKDFLRCR